MKEILAYSNSARPLRANEGQVFINVKTMEMFIFHDGYWRPLVELPEKEAKTMVFPKITPSTPEKELVSEPVVEIEEPAPVVEEKVEEPKPKKKASTSKKKTTKKVEK